jgi:hypothetical protein
LTSGPAASTSKDRPSDVTDLLSGTAVGQHFPGALPEAVEVAVLVEVEVEADSPVGFLSAACGEAQMHGFHRIVVRDRQLPDVLVDVTSPVLYDISSLTSWVGSWLLRFAQR